VVIARVTVILVPGTLRNSLVSPELLNKKQVTLRLDADLIDWFKARQGGLRGYQTAINAALRKAVEGERRKAA
jgi:uncharacterized protein (DUF4415 family)